MAHINQACYLTDAEWRIYSLVNWTIIGSDNDLAHVRLQTIIRTNTELLSIHPRGTYLHEISIKFKTFSFKKMHLNVSSAKWRPFCLSLNVLNTEQVR